MNEIRKVARAYYDGQTEEEKQVAGKLFRSLDENGDGKVSLKEYKKHVDPSFCCEQVFKKLDENGDGTLDFDEVLTLYYMGSVSLPRCSACLDVLLSSSYFSCLPCLGKTSYHLCCKCYGGGKFRHLHSSTKFADTRALLKLADRLLRNADVATTCVSKEEQEGGAGSKAKPEQSSITPTRSTTKTVVKTVAVCATRTIIIKRAIVVATSAGCSIM